MQRWDEVSSLPYFSLNVIVCNTLQKDKINTFFCISHNYDISFWYKHDQLVPHNSGVLKSLAISEISTATMNSKVGCRDVQFNISGNKPNTANAVSYICQKEKLQVTQGKKNCARGEEQYCQFAKIMMTLLIWSTGWCYWHPSFYWFWCNMQQSSRQLWSTFSNRLLWYGDK